MTARWRGRLDRLEGWALDRQDRLTDAIAAAYEQDPDAMAALERLWELTDAVQSEPPRSWRLHPKLVVRLARERRMSPAEVWRREWQRHVVAQTPEGRALLARLEAVAERVMREWEW